MNPEDMETWLIEAFKQVKPDPAIKGFSVDLESMSLIPRYTSRLEEARPVCGNGMRRGCTCTACQTRQPVSNEGLCSAPSTPVKEHGLTLANLPESPDISSLLDQ